MHDASPPLQHPWNPRNPQHDTTTTTRRRRRRPTRVQRRRRRRRSLARSLARAHVRWRLRWRWRCRSPTSQSTKLKYQTKQSTKQSTKQRDFWFVVLNTAGYVREIVLSSYCSATLLCLVLCFCVVTARKICDFGLVCRDGQGTREETDRRTAGHRACDERARLAKRT